MDWAHGHEWSDVISHDGRHGSGCRGLCAVYWPPVLTSEQRKAGPGGDQHALGVIMRLDGSYQVTYHGRPLYLFNNDAYRADSGGRDKENQGRGYVHIVGVFNTIPPLP